VSFTRPDSRPHPCSQQAAAVMTASREAPFSRTSDYSIFLGAPTRGEVERSLYPVGVDATSSVPTPVVWEVIHSTLTWPNPPTPASLPPSAPAVPLSQPASSASLGSSSSQRRPTRSTHTHPPPAASSGTRIRPKPTPSPPKATSKSTPTPSPHSSEAVGTYSFETSGPSSGRRGTTNRGPEWTPILTPPSQDGKRAAVVGDVTGRSLVGEGAKGLMSMVQEEDEEDHATAAGESSCPVPSDDLTC
jgi:hypothetical protein